MANAPGLMDSTALTPPNVGAPPDAAPPMGAAPAPDDEGSQQATPQEEAQMEQFLGQCKMLVYNPKTPQVTQAIIKSLSSGSDPIKALASVSVGVAQRVEDAANQSGEKLDPSILLQGGYEVVRDIADFSTQVSKAQGTPTYTDKQVQQAYLMAVDMYRTNKQQTGGMDTQAAQQDWSTLQQADKAGQLDSVLPGATDAAKELAPVAAEATAKPGVAAAKTAVPALRDTGKPKKKKRRR